MAELLSVQVHVPLTKAEDGHLMEQKLVTVAGAGFTRLKKIDNADIDPAAPAPFQFDYLPRRRAVDIEFKGLTYSVSEGRKKGRIINQLYSTTHLYSTIVIPHSYLK